MRLIIKGLIPLGLCLLGGCREKASVVELPPEETGRMYTPAPDGNMLGGLPGPVYRSQADSAIHWQPWTAESFQKARDSQRMIFAVVVMPQQPSYAEVLAELESRRDVVDEINSNYVPVLIDGDAVREIGLLTVQLCAEIRSPLQLPLMIWMTPEGAPVAWMPLQADSGQEPGEMFEQSHVVLKRMWEDEKGYIVTNSAMDQNLRRERMKETYRKVEKSDDAAMASVSALRQLVSLYDPLSHTLDETGGLFPSGPLDLLAAGVQTEGLPDDLRERSREVLVGVLDDLMCSAMFDPLDGGVFSSRQGTDWTLPGFSRTCSGQARVAVSLLETYAATGDERALDRAMGLFDFVEKNYLTEDDMYSFGGRSPRKVTHWLWEFEEVRDLLSPAEFPVFWIAAGLKENGNIPSENDPERKYFRLNTLRNAKDADEVAATLGADPGEVAALLKSAKAKLLKAREARIGMMDEGADANASATLRMVSAFATAYRITGDKDYRDRAVALLAKTKEAFSDERKLRLYRGEVPNSLTGGRAFLYAVAIQAALDVHAITLAEDWKIWAGDLASTAAELFVEDDYVREASIAMDLCNMPISSNAMVFDESTIGLFAMAEKRLSSLDIPMSKSLEQLVGGTPQIASSSPVLYTDVIQVALVKGYGNTYIIGEKTSAELKEAILRLPLRSTSRKLSDDEPGKVRVVDADGSVTEVQDAGEIVVPSLP
ncbi:MAG: DUF255 domain-containing protein [Luteolibacter sp.]